MKNCKLSPLFFACVVSATLSTAHAAPVQVTYDFTSGGSTSSTSGSGYGNSLLYNDIDGNNSASENLTVTAWGATGPNLGGAWGDSIETGEISRWSTGLGACNRTEGTVGGGCSTNAEHQVDNKSYDDLVLFTFDYAVNFDEIVIDPYFSSGSDVDFTYWVGNLTNFDLTGLDDVTLLTAGFGAQTDVTFYGTTTAPQTISLGGGFGNALLVGAQRDIGAPDDDDYFKIASLTATVPVPAAVWLFGSGLLGLVGVARRKAA